MKKLLAFLIILATFIVTSHVALAHVVVKPGESLTSSFLTFTMGVPNEKDNPVTSIKLLIPDGVQFVTPTFKQGWTITTEKEGTGEDAKVKSITWSAGSIPTGFRDDFTFSAKTPDTATDLQWKAYETYQNGETVAWDQDPAKGKDVKPFSVTKVTSKSSDEAKADSTTQSNNNSSNAVAYAALAASLVSLALATRKHITKK